jgi:hypothetical protein
VCGRLGDRRHILKPHPFEDGAFFFGRSYPGLTSTSLKGIPAKSKVNSGGWTTLLWIKRVFGVCGELWLVSRLLGFDCDLSRDVFRDWGRWRRKNGWEKHGQNVVSCVVFVDSSLVANCPMREVEFPTCRTPANPLRSKEDCCLPLFCNLVGVISGRSAGFGSIRRALLRVGMTRPRASLRLNFGKAAMCTSTSMCRRKSMLPFSLPAQEGPTSIRCSRSETIGIVW